LLLALLRAAGLTKPSTWVRTTLRSPVEYQVDLDLGSWLRRLAFLDGGYETNLPGFLTRLRESHPDSGSVLDVGANVGLISLPTALLLGRSAAAMPFVCAIEPTRANLSALRHNLALNGLQERVSVVGFAAGSRNRSAWIHVEGGLEVGEGTGTANILPESIGRGDDGQPIEERTLDSLRTQGALPKRVTVMKLDTDGYDLKVLEGASELLMSDRPFVFGEFTGHCLAWHGQGVAGVLELAERLDYQVFAPSKVQFRFRAAPTLGNAENLLLVPRELVSRVRWCIDRDHE